MLRSSLYQNSWRWPHNYFRIGSCQGRSLSTDAENLRRLKPKKLALSEQLEAANHLTSQLEVAKGEASQLMQRELERLLPKSSLY
jgi:hypothetical protein